MCHTRNDTTLQVQPGPPHAVLTAKRYQYYRIMHPSRPMPMKATAVLSPLSGIHAPCD